VDESLTKTYSHDTNLNGQKGEKIEILSVALLERNRELVESLKRLARSLHLEFGWHYLLDLTWIIENLGEIDGKKIMDAGAGVGIIQWYLAQQGAEIISVDRLNRSELSMKLRSRYHVQGLRGCDLIPTRSMFKKNFSREIQGSFYRRWVKRSIGLARDFLQMFRNPGGSGRIILYNQDLTDLVDIPSDSLDAVVSVSFDKYSICLPRYVPTIQNTTSFSRVCPIAPSCAKTWRVFISNPTRTECPGENGIQNTSRLGFAR
jgi:hypothetical protein